MQTTSPLEIFMNDCPNLSKAEEESLKMKVFLFFMLTIASLLFGGSWESDELFLLSVMGPLVITCLIFVFSVIHFETMRKEKMNDYFLVFLNVLLISVLLFICAFVQTSGQIVNVVLIGSFAIGLLALSVKQVRDWSWGSVI